MIPELRQALSALDHLERSLRRGLADALNATVDRVAADAARLAPRDTGRLVGSIQVEHATPATLVASVSVGEGLESPGEAAAIEFGTVDMSPSPFFRPAIGRNLPNAVAAIKRATREAL